MKLADHLNSLQIIPRVISVALAATAIYLSVRIVDAILDGGVVGVAEVSALSGLVVAFLTTSSALVGMLSRADVKHNGHHKKD